MTHRVERQAEGVLDEPAAVAPADRDALDLVAAAPLIVLGSSVLIGLSLVLTSLAAAGVADVLPVGLRAAIVCLVAVTLPGLPIAALLRLPTNGIFASVTIAISLAVGELLAQLNFLAGLRQSYLCQMLVLVAAAIATGVIARQWYSHRAVTSPATAWARVKVRLGAPGDRLPSVGLLAGSLVLFGIAVARLDTEAAGEFGLLEALGADYFVGLALLSVVLVLEYRRAVIDRPVVALMNVVLITYVTMPVAWADRTAPFVTAYVHRVITNWIATLGTLPPPVDARISWAGFFSTAAQLTKLGGLPDSAVFVGSASLVFGILLVYPLYAVGLAVTRNEKTAWLGVTVFVLSNWYQQDYFAPQAVAMQFYATILAVLLWQLRVSNVPALDGGVVRRWATAWMRIPGRVPNRGAGWTQAVELVLVMIIAAMVVGHQLTPVVTIAALVVFATMGLTRSKLLWLIALLMFVAWFSYGAYGFWQGHLGDILADIGGVDQNLSSSVSNDRSADPTYGRMQYLRIAASLAVFCCAGLGWLRMPRGPWRPLVGVLAIIPFGLIALQSYGGEVAIRCFLYASPLLAPLTAIAFQVVLRPPAAHSRWHWPAAVLAPTLFFALAVWVTTNRGLNTSFEHSTREEVEISNQLQQQAGTTPVAYWGQGGLNGIVPKYDLNPACLRSARALADCTATPDIGYFIETNQDDKYLEYRMGMDKKTIDEAMNILVSEKGFRWAYRGAQVRVLQRTELPPLKLGMDR